MGARYYEGSSGRFLSPDPYGHAASLSLYDYAGGDPINFVDSTGRLQVGQQSQGATQDSGFRFYEHAGAGQVGCNAMVNVVEAERSRSMAMGAFYTNRAAAFTIGDAATSTMPKEVWNQSYGSYLQRTDAFMWMGYMAGGLEGALANENTTLTLFGVALGGLAAPVAAEGIIAGGLVAGNGVMGAATWTMTQANNIRAVGVSVYLMSRQPGAYQAFNQFLEEGIAMFSGYDGPSLSPVGFADDVISGVRRGLNSVGDVVAGAKINYGALGFLGRPSGVTATITQDMIGAGSPPLMSIIPPGFQGGALAKHGAIYWATSLGDLVLKFTIW